jgi:hypothetical protein
VKRCEIASRVNVAQESLDGMLSIAPIKRGDSVIWHPALHSLFTADALLHCLLSAYQAVLHDAFPLAHFPANDACVLPVRE